jgi:hypothetical protein
VRTVHGRASSRDVARAWALQDRRGSVTENWEERTSLALGDGDGGFIAAVDAPLLHSPHPPFGLRYSHVVPLPAVRPGG